MKVQVVRRADADSQCGYDALINVSESCLCDSVSSIQDLKRKMEASGYTSSQHTILYGGRPEEELIFSEDLIILQRRILAIPKDLAVKIILPDRELLSNVQSYACTINDLKEPLLKLFNDTAMEIVMINTFGTILNDTSCLSVQYFDETKSLICREQIKEYFDNSLQCDRLSSVLGQARSLQHQWCSVEDHNISEQIEQVTKAIAKKLKSALKVNSNVFGMDGRLKSFQYDIFKQDFPPHSAWPLKNCDQLAKLNSVFDGSKDKYSACPGLAIKLIKALISELGSTNVNFACQCAQLLGTLVEPISFLAEKRPKVHNHGDYNEKLKKVERSLNNYKDIMAWKMFSSPDELQQREQSLLTLREVKRITMYLC